MDEAEKDYNDSVGYTLHQISRAVNETSGHNVRLSPDLAKRIRNITAPELIVKRDNLLKQVTISEDLSDKWSWQVAPARVQDIATFAKTHFGITVTPYQLEFLEAAVKAEPGTILARPGRAMGMSTCRKILAEYTKEVEK